MYLKSLEIQGFKSFPDKTILNFDSDITAIVGPNGSGKSNISDAISWVMGEQSSRALRGVKMEDVIFGGTLKRSQVGFAEASLVLDNSDNAFPVETHEVMVTRRYYRSGESEYYINKQSARLKDLHELFMDTGLGREGYSNIGQGKIDEILSVKSTDRREVFEEAAGISKFRHRKEETERRLANTQDNLLRIGDKISELELQIGPLEKQAEQAKKYLSYREELKGLEVTVWLDSLEKLSAAAKKAEEDYTSAEFILTQSREELGMLYARLEELSESLRQEDQNSEQIRQNISALEAQRQKKDGEISVAQAHIANYAQNVERIRQELEDQGNRADGLVEQISQKECRVEELAEDLKTLENQLMQAEKESNLVSQNAEDLEKQLLALHSQQAKLTSEIAQKNGELSAMSFNMEEFTSRKAVALQEQAEAQKKWEEASQNLLQCQDSLAQAREQVAASENRIAGYTLRYKAREEKRSALAKQMEDMEIQRKTFSSKLAILTEMEQEYEGYSKAVKQVMKEAGRGGLSNIVGPVSQNIQVLETYTVAIEIGLGAAMQQIIVEKEENAKAAIQFLKRHNLGRATFLPLSTIQGKSLQEKGLDKARGFVGIASHLVQYESRIKGIIENLLGRTVIVENLDAAIEMSQNYGNRFRIVTLDGQVVHAGGSMTGGSVSRDAGILSRGNERKKLSQLLQDLEERKKELEKQLEQASRATEEVAFQLTAAQGELRTAEEQVLHMEGDEKQCAFLVSAAKEKVENCRLTLLQLESRSQSDVSKSENLQQALAQLEQQRSQLEQAVAHMEQGLADLETKSSRISQEITEYRMQAASYEAERKTAQETISQLQQLQLDLQGDYTQKQETIAHYESQITQLQAQIESLKTEKSQIEDSVSKEKTNFQEILKTRQNIEAEKTKTDHTIQEKNKNLLLMERESARQEQKKVTAAMEEKQILDKLWDSYELTRSTAYQVQVKLESLSAANRQIGELRKKISALGTPNLGAIDEFARIHERYSYLTAQRDDVLHAKKELENIVTTITQEMTEIFVREFGKINQHFSRTFTEMFGGGKAALELEDPHEPLNCGIEIRVQPPGKQLKTITLLSGGEKAFVAIALYFAILKVRPTPFCMLDEIDAALDDRNVERFAGYLRNLCNKTQFIVITHRRGTMEASDALYGVTMQEEGISKILRLNLNEVEKQLGLAT